MRAYEYGLKYYGQESVRDPESNIYAFDDEIQTEDAPEPEGMDTNYLELKFSSDNPGTFEVVPGGKVINIREQEYISNSGASSELALAFEDALVYYKDSWLQRDIYQHQGTYYVPIGSLLNTTRVNDRFKTPRAPKPIEQLNAVLAQRNVSVILFLSRDGVQLERAYQAIDELYENEIVFFIERNDDTNYFGSVTRVKSGSNITVQSNPPYEALSNVCRIFKTDVNRNHFKEMIEDHVDDKNSNLYLIKKKVFGFFTKVVIVPANFAYETLAQGMDFVSEQLDKLRLEEYRWRYYQEDGRPVDEPKLLLPGIDLIRNLQEQHKKNPAYEPSKLARLAIGTIDKIETEVKEGIDALNGIKSLQSFVKGRLSPLLKILAEAKAFLKDPVEKGLQLAETGFVIFNAFIVGVLNSLIDSIKGIFDLISLACKAVVALNKEAAKAAANPASYISMLFEMLENVIETVQQVFTMENFKAFFAFLKKTVSHLLKSPPSLDIHVDAIAYYTGYIIGFIIEEVVMAILTGGAKTVAEAIKLVAQSFRKLATSMVEFGTKSVRKLRQLTEVSIDALLTIFDLVREKLKNVPKLLDELWEWFLSLISKGKAVYDDITEWLLKQYEISKATLDLFRELGIVIGRNIGDGLQGQRALAGPGYQVLYNNKNIFEGTEEAIVAFSKRVDEIRATSGSGKSKRYIDDVAAGKRYALSFSRKALKKLDQYVADALSKDKDLRPGAASLLEGMIKGKYRKQMDHLVSYSAAGLSEEERLRKLHPLVKEWLYKIADPRLRNRGTHGKCAENFAISDWLFKVEDRRYLKKGSLTLDEAQEAFSSVICKTKRIQNKRISPLVHGQNKSACHSCNPMLEHFKIKEILD